MPHPDILSQLVPHEPFDYPGVIFDFDGTIADSMHVWAWVDREFMSRHGLVEPPDYGRIDRACEHIIAANPNALLVPRVNADAPREKDDW